MVYLKIWIGCNWVTLGKYASSSDAEYEITKAMRKQQRKYNYKIEPVNIDNN